MATAGRTVLFSGVIVAAALGVAADLPAELPALDGVRAAWRRCWSPWWPRLTVLPAVLALLGRRLEWGAMPWRAPRGAHRRRRCLGPDRPQRDASPGPLPDHQRVGAAAARLPRPRCRLGQRSTSGCCPPTHRAGWPRRRWPRRSAARRRSADVVLTGAGPAATEAYAATLRQVGGVVDVRIVDDHGRGGSAVLPGAGDLARQRPDRRQPGPGRGPARGAGSRRRHRPRRRGLGADRRPDRLRLRPAAVDGRLSWPW